MNDAIIIPFFAFSVYLMCHKHFNLQMFIKNDTAILIKTSLPEGIFFLRQQHQQFYSCNKVAYYYYYN